jgi:cell division protein FtsI (penicillin-binding protein 3)
MRRALPTFSFARSAFVLALLVIALWVLMGRVGYLQTIGRDRTLSQAERQQYQVTPLQARRGTIFDRNGMLMAGTIQTHTLFVDPAFMLSQYESEGRSLVQMDEDLQKLADLIGRDAFELSQLIGDRAQSRYLKIAENLDDATAAAVRKLKLPGVGLHFANARYYPMGSIAAHVLGGVGRDGGIEGLELKFNSLLAGKDGSVRERKDARRRAIAVEAGDYRPPEHGQHLVLTIDANIQMIAEQELAARCEMFRAKRGEVVVMDPRTGEILALANWPTFNPQNLEDSSPELRRNRTLTDPYEPGSTIKPFIVAPALAWKLTRPGEVFAVNGPTYRTSYGRRISDVHGYPQLALWDVLVKSSNIGMCMLAERMGNTRLHKAVTGFGFGSVTGIELPGEDPGRVNALKHWSKYSTESVAQGYELMVTPLQLVRAMAVFANGGRLVQPRIVAGTLRSDGSIESLAQTRKLELMPEVITPETAVVMKRILADVPVRGTATRARSQVWNIFGKTGTSHISGGKAGYDEERYTSSFIGGAPAENARLVIAFVIHEPDRDYAWKAGYSHYGGAVAAPGAARVLERSLAYLQVPASPDLPEPSPEVASVLYNYNPRLYRLKHDQLIQAEADTRETH